jgi:hypothetical protein
VDRFLLSLGWFGCWVGTSAFVGCYNEGPKTYLLLVQNEDELRPTGGFITAAGTLLLQDGKIGNLEFSNSGNADNWTKPYPSAPWQLREYMNSPVLVFRDTNWFVNYPTATRYVEQLYSYTSNHSVDGVIAFDQQTLVDIRVLLVDPGELDYQSTQTMLFLHAAAKTPPEEAASPSGTTKLSSTKLPGIMVKIFSGDAELSHCYLFVKD